MAPHILVATTLAVFYAATAGAECIAPELGLAEPTNAGAAPQPPDPARRPVRPACLPSPDTPAAEDCDPETIALYGAQIADWSLALNSFVEDSYAFANRTVAAANAAIALAEAARGHAEDALAFAECEAAAINEASD